MSRLGDENTGAAQEALEGRAEVENSPVQAAAVACQMGGLPWDERHRDLVATGGSGGGNAVDVQRLSFAELLDTLGLVDEDFVAVCYQPVGGTFQAQVTSCGNAAAAVFGLPERSCVWFTPNPTAGPERRGQGRGRERDVKRWVALYADLDVKTGAFRGIAEAEAFINVLSVFIGTRPTAVIHSGHGLQPLWRVEDGDLGDEVQWARAYRLIRQFGRLATSAAFNFCGARIDNVYNADRLLRVPDTLNLKDPDHPVPTGAVADTGGPLTVESIEEFLAAYGAIALESDQPVADEIVLAPDGWAFGNQDCAYVQTMVASWNRESDRPRAGRHQWAMKKAVRLAAAHRRGCLTEDGLAVALEYLHDALAHWCSEVGDYRTLHHREIDSAYQWAIKKVATFTEERIDKELGGHTHRKQGDGPRSAAGDPGEEHVAVEPVPLVDGAELLDAVMAVLKQYVVFPDEHAVVATALWVAATHAIDCWNAAPRLVINSPQKRCGKTRTLDVICGLCHQPLITVNATAAAVFRSLAGERPPTLVIDEADTIFGSKRVAEQNEELRALLNAGHQRGRPALRCVGNQQTPTEFPTFAMAALAGIGLMPDTVTDRAVNITMRRRMQGEHVAQYRVRRDEPILHGLRDRLAVWARAHTAELTGAVPEMPVEDRAADTWEPLIAVADRAGGRWPQMARAACVAMVAGADDTQEERSVQVRLLTDIRTIFTEQDVKFMSSLELVQHLKNVTESPWADWGLTTSRLARDLAPFGIRPGHNVEKTMRGYRLEYFHDAFTRYIRPESSDLSGTTDDQR
jgi:hypothetical protein